MRLAYEIFRFRFAGRLRLGRRGFRRSRGAWAVALRRLRGHVSEAEPCEQGRRINEDERTKLHGCFGFIEYQPFKGEISGRQNGSLISLEQGTSIPFSLNNLQERGKFFISPNENIYEGQVIGENSRAGDLCVNVTKTKKMSNMRSSGADEKVRLAPPKLFSLEECLEYIQGDEYVEVTPQNLRIRKVLLKETERKRGIKIS